MHKKAEAIYYITSAFIVYKNVLLKAQLRVLLIVILN